MKRGIKINFSNRLLYAIVILGIILIVTIGVYATVTPGTAPNPGHSLSQISPLTNCDPGQFISWNGTDLTCTSVSSSFDTHCYQASQVDTSNNYVQVFCYNGVVTGGGCDCSNSGGIVDSNPMDFKTSIPGAEYTWSCVCASSSGTKRATIVCCI